MRLADQDPTDCILIEPRSKTRSCGNLFMNRTSIYFLRIPTIKPRINRREMNLIGIYFNRFIKIYITANTAIKIPINKKTDSKLR